MVQNDPRAEEIASIKRKNKKKIFSVSFGCFCLFLVVVGPFSGVQNCLVPRGEERETSKRTTLTIKQGEDVLESGSYLISRHLEYPERKRPAIPNVLCLPRG